MRIKNEEELLDTATRKRIIEEIKGSENCARKQECLRRYEVYKDQTKKHVVAALAAEGLQDSTVQQMANRAANISICRKIVNKKARAYNGGVRRETGVEVVNAQIDVLTRLMDFDRTMRKGDRYRELQKNSMLCAIPDIDTEESTPEKQKYRLKLSVMAPWQYDVVEDYYDRERMVCLIISDFDRTGISVSTGASEARAGVHGAKPVRRSTDGKDNTIADSPEDQGAGEAPLFKWWSGKYHFTTDEQGETVSAPELNLNPIGMLPAVNNAEDQDGRFWAVGGDDIVDGSILVNKTITDMNFIAYLQGFGQFVITGTNLGKARTSTGPNNAIMIEYDPSKDEAQPSVDIISANPPLEAWMRMVEQYMALLLTTNNLASSNVSSQLSANSFPSGIAMLIEQSESTDDVTTKQADYVSKERYLLEVTRRWLNLYLDTDNMCSDFAEVGKLPDTVTLSVKFVEGKPAVSEAERLENIKRRKELGINEQVDLIMIDNPDMTREEAASKLLKISEEKLKQVSTAVEGAIDSAVSGPDTGIEEAMPDGLAGAAAVAAPGTPDVQQLSLNGAQVESLLSIIAQVSAGTLPKSSAKALIAGAFSMDDATIDSIIGPITVGNAPAVPAAVTVTT